MWGGVKTRQHVPSAVYTNADGSELMIHGTVRSFPRSPSLPPDLSLLPPEVLTGFGAGHVRSAEREESGERWLGCVDGVRGGGEEEGGVEDEAVSGASCALAPCARTKRSLLSRAAERRAVLAGLARQSHPFLSLSPRKECRLTRLSAQDGAPLSKALAEQAAEGQ